jgi:hypothetical protein
MKRFLLPFTTFLISLTAFGQNPNACTAISGCVPSNGYCSVPASGGDLDAGAVGVFYSDIVQLTAANDFLGSPIDNVSMVLTSAPAGLTIVFTPNSGVETSCAISGGESACFTVYGTPTSAGIDQEVVIGVVATSGMTTLPITLTYLIDVDGTASLKEQKTTSFSVFPNPSSSEIKITSAKSSKIVIMDVLGQKVASLPSNGSLVINVSSWKTGVYFILNEESGERLKFIKK